MIRNYLFLFFIIFVLQNGVRLQLFSKIYVLLPLSGPHSFRGLTQKKAIELAFIENYDPINQTANAYQLIFEDSQCIRKTEIEILMEVLNESTAPVISIGGDCSENGVNVEKEVTEYIPSGSIQNLLQISFENSFMKNSKKISTGHKFYHLFDEIVSFMKYTTWRTVTIMYGDNNRYHRISNYMETNLRKNNISIGMRVRFNDNIIEQMKSLLIRPIILITSFDQAMKLMSAFSAERFFWLLPYFNRSIQNYSNNIRKYNHYQFSSEIDIDRAKLLSSHGDLASKFTKNHPDISEDILLSAINAYKAAKLVSLSLSQTFTDSSNESILNLNVFKDLLNSMKTLHFKDEDSSNKSSMVLFKKRSQYGNLGPDFIDQETKTERNSFFIMILISSLAFLGIIYTVAILCYNIMWRKERIIKMTSPNINVIILFGAVIAYISLPLMNLDSETISLNQVTLAHKVAVFLLPIGYTLIFGSSVAKSWRVYMIFKNLNFNGKTTRDEHLVCGVTLLVLLDLAVLLSWMTVDEIICKNEITFIEYKIDKFLDIYQNVPNCYSKYSSLWYALLYVIKSPVVIAGIYFTLKIRHVSVPSLQDWQEVLIAHVSLMIAFVIFLPWLLMKPSFNDYDSLTITLAVFSHITCTIALLFIPKIILLRKAKQLDAPDTVQFLFSKSLEKTSNENKNYNICCFQSSNENESGYAQEILTNEIDSLTQKLKEKDVIIRDLTDRLYFGMEKIYEKQYHDKLQKQYKRSSETQSEPTSGSQNVMSLEDHKSLPDIYTGGKYTSFMEQEQNYYHKIKRRQLVLQDYRGDEITNENMICDYENEPHNFDRNDIENNRYVDDSSTNQFSNSENQMNPNRIVYCENDSLHIKEFHKSNDTAIDNLSPNSESSDVSSQGGTQNLIRNTHKTNYSNIQQNGDENNFTQKIIIEKISDI